MLQNFDVVKENENKKAFTCYIILNEIGYFIPWRLKPASCNSIDPIMCLSRLIDIQSPWLFINVLFLEPFFPYLWQSCNLGNEILWKIKSKISYLGFLSIKILCKLPCHFQIIPIKLMKKWNPRCLLKYFKALWIYISYYHSLWFNSDIHFL